MYPIYKKEGSVNGLSFIPTLEPKLSDDVDGFINGVGYVEQEFSACNRKVLAEALAELKSPKCIVEIGVARAKGYSEGGQSEWENTSTYMILKNKPKDCIYIGLDLEDKSKLNDKENNVYTIMGDCSNHSAAYELMEKLGVNQIDLLLIDGWHSVNQCVRDWGYTEKLSSDGVVIMHDVHDHPGPQALFEAIDTNLYDKNKYCIVPGDWGIAVAKRKTGIASIGKKKVAVLFKGPVRPRIDLCLRNVSLIRDAFKKHDCDMFLFAWDTPEAREFIKMVPGLKGYLVPEPDDNFIETNILTSRCEICNRPANVYKHFSTLRAGIDIIRSYGEYDFIFYIRLDLECHIDDVDLWLNKDFYTAPGGMWVEKQKVQSSDIMGCAPPNMMAAAWNFRDDDTLNKIYGSSLCAEDTLEKIMFMNGVPLLRMKAIDLDGHPPCPNKHFADYRICRHHHKV